MYPYVGAVNNKHRQTIDLMMGGLRLAVINDQDLIKLNDEAQKDLRTKLVVQLARNETLQSQLVNARRNLTQVNPSETNVTLILEGGKLAQAVAELETQKKRFAVEADGRLVGISRTNLLPRLAFSDKGEMIRSDLRNDDLNRKVSLNGFVTISPIDAYQQWPIDKTFGNILIAKRLGANVIRLNIIPQLALDKIETTARIVEEAERNGMYIILSPASKYIGTDFNDIKKTPYGNGMPDDEIVGTVTQLAEKLDPYDNVILDTWTEIGGEWGRDAQLHGVLTRMISSIRAVNKHAIIAVPSCRASMDFRYYVDHPINDPCVIYGINDDPYQPFDNPGKEENVRNLWTPLIPAQRPILIRESAFPYPNDEQRKREPVWISQSLQFTLDYPYQVHFTGFLLAGEGWKNDIVATERTANALNAIKLPKDLAPDLQDIYLTPRGYPMAEKYKKNPPTQFDK